jgi:MFS family permease
MLGAVSEGPRPTRRLEAASALWTTGEAIYLVGLIVYAFQVGGAPVVALVTVLQSLPSVVLAPAFMAATERIRRQQLLAGVLAVRFLAIAAAGALLATDGPAAGVLVVAAIDGIASTVLRPIRGTLVPMLARSPEELVAANVGITTGMSGASLVGPAVAAAVLALGSVQATFLLAAVLILAALATTARLRNVADGPVSRPMQRPGLAGLKALADLPAARTIIAVTVGQRFIRGMLTVLVATTALQLLVLDDAGVGVLNAAVGLGMVLGSVLSVALVGQPRLAAAFAGAIALQGLGLAGPALVPLVVPAFAFFVASGAGKAILEVAGNSLLQRTIPTAARGQVLALLESFVTASLAAGAVAASLLVNWLGPSGALLAAGGLEVVLAVISWPWIRTVDAAAVVPERQMRLLRSVAFFRPLQLTTIEDLAGRLENVNAPAGADIVLQGEAGDRFYIVETGRLETLIDGEPIRALGPGDAFGEIALLRDVPRTATVRASTDATLASLTREDFLSAVTGHTDSATAAEAVVTSRVGPRADPAGLA